MFWWMDRDIVGWLISYISRLISHKIAILQGLDTATPVLTLTDGTLMDGHHRESVGEQLFVEASLGKQSDESSAQAARLIGKSKRIVRFTNRQVKKEAGPKKDPSARFQYSKLVNAPAVEKRETSKVDK